uniref:Uncharacterized protein n=1 Tax=Anguilla anguilla TaxID=7936 RepID=A0A0E9UTA7_ANGAN
MWTVVSVFLYIHCFGWIRCLIYILYLLVFGLLS